MGIPLLRDIVKGEGDTLKVGVQEFNKYSSLILESCPKLSSELWLLLKILFPETP